MEVDREELRKFMLWMYTENYAPGSVVAFVSTVSRCLRDGQNPRDNDAFAAYVLPLKSQARGHKRSAWRAYQRFCGVDELPRGVSRLPRRKAGEAVPAVVKPQAPSVPVQVIRAVGALARLWQLDVKVWTLPLAFVRTAPELMKHLTWVVDVLTEYTAELHIDENAPVMSRVHEMHAPWLLEMDAMYVKMRTKIPWKGKYIGEDDRWTTDQERNDEMRKRGDELFKPIPTFKPSDKPIATKVENKADKASAPLQAVPSLPEPEDEE